MASSLLDYTVPGSTGAPTGGGPIRPGLYSQASAGVGAPPVAGAVGTAPLTGIHNTPIHVAGWGIGALIVIIAMHKAGFRLVSVGRYGGR